MTRDDIIGWMQEVGAKKSDPTPQTYDGFVDLFQRFAALAVAEKDKKIERLREARTSTIALCEQINAENNLLRGKNQQLREALDNLIVACELPGDHCEVEQALPYAKAALQEQPR
jgi:hypothetical protein